MTCRFLLLIALLFGSITTDAQKKSDKKIIKKLKADINFLASDALEGRRAATEGEMKAAAFFVEKYKKAKISPYQSDYVLPFNFVYGKEIANSTALSIDNHSLKLHTDYFPLPFSGSSSSTIIHEVYPDILEKDNIWLMPLYNSKEEADNAHFDFEKQMHDKAIVAKKQGALAVIFFDNYGAKYPPSFQVKSETETVEIPVLFITHNAYDTFLSSNKSTLEFSLQVNINKSERTGHNVVAMIDNKAPYTVVLGAHFDHLGYGEDGNSTYRGTDKMIHNGADDNASGSAGLLQLASWIKSKKLKNYNYLFIHFSAEELGLLGSKAVVKQLGLDSNKIAYMVNMDMIGRLNDSTHSLTVGGVGTSPVWGQFIEHGKKDFKIHIDSAGIGPSDHTSFYQQGIPVLFFFTGIHHDYHKPSDDADKINYTGELSVLKYIYSIVEVMDTRPKPLFTPTKQTLVGKTKFKVTLGIMPDYTYENGDGIRVDGVTEGRPAIKAGIKAGDIITQIGDYKVLGMQTYMEALGKFNEGDSTTVKIIRDKKQKTLKLSFK